MNLSSSSDETEASVSKEAKQLLEIFLRRKSIGCQDGNIFDPELLGSHLKVVNQIRDQHRNENNETQTDGRKDSIESSATMLLSTSTETLTNAAQHHLRQYLNQTPSSIGSTDSTCTPTSPPSGGPRGDVEESLDMVTTLSGEQLDMLSTSHDSPHSNQSPQHKSHYIPHDNQYASNRNHSLPHSNQIPLDGKYVPLRNQSLPHNIKSFPQSHHPTLPQGDTKAPHSNQNGGKSVSTAPAASSSPAQEIQPRVSQSLDSKKGNGKVTEADRISSKSYKDHTDLSPIPIGRSKSQGDVKSAHTVESRLSSDQMSLSSAAGYSIGGRGRVSSQDTGYEADVDKKTRKKRSKTQTSFIRKTSALFATIRFAGGASKASKSKDVYQMAKETAQEYVRSQISQDDATYSHYEGSPSSSRREPETRAKSLPRTDNSVIPRTDTQGIRRSASGSIQSPLSIINPSLSARSTFQSERTKSIPGRDSIDSVGSAKSRAPFAQFEDDGLSENEDRDVESTATTPTGGSHSASGDSMHRIRLSLSVDPIPETRKQKRKKKWYKRAWQPAEDNIFVRLFRPKEDKSRGPGVTLGGHTPHIGGTIGNYHTKPTSSLERQHKDSGYTSSPHGSVLQPTTSHATGTGDPDVLSGQASSSETSIGELGGVTRTFWQVIDSGRFRSMSLISPPTLDSQEQEPTASSRSGDRSRLHLDLSQKPGVVEHIGTSSSSGSYGSINRPPTTHVQPPSTAHSDSSSPLPNSEDERRNQEKVELTAAMLEMIANRIMGKHGGYSSEKEASLAKRMDEIIKAEKAGTRSRNVSGCSQASEATIRARKGSTLNNSRVDLTGSGKHPGGSTSGPEAGEPEDSFELDKAFKARSKRYKRLHLSRETMDSLCEPSNYSSYQVLLERVVGRSPGWHNISVLYYRTRQAIRHLASREEHYTKEQMVLFKERIKKYSMRYFDIYFATWVDAQGGWQAVVEDTEDSELD